MKIPTKVVLNRVDISSKREEANQVRYIPKNVKMMSTSINGSVLSFIDSTNSLNHYCAFNNSFVKPKNFFSKLFNIIYF